MAHDVFISHAHKDRMMADAICQKLESAQVRCWIAERDISVGEDWTEATRNAIGSSRVMVLVLSENANAAPHIEREIAHAFYTKRAIFPVRLTETPPRRDFLFYLGNVRWFDAFAAPPEQQLEGLAASINDMVRSRPVNRAITPVPGPTRIPPSLNFSDSWLGSLRASHYRTLEILKRVAIAALVLAFGWLLWSLHSQTNDREAALPSAVKGAPISPSRSLGSPPQRMEGLAAKPAYSYSRFGLWVAPSATPIPSVQEESSEPLSALPSNPPVKQTPLPQPAVNGRAEESADSSRERGRRSSQSVKSGSTRTNGQRDKPKTKAHHGKVRQSRISNLEKRLKRAWDKAMGRKRKTDNR